MLSGLTSAFITNVSNDERISAEVSAQVGVAAGTGIDFLTVDEVQTALDEAGVDAATSAAIIDDYSQAQIQALKTGLLAAALLALLSLPFTRDLPHEALLNRKGSEPQEVSA